MSAPAGAADIEGKDWVVVCDSLCKADGDFGCSRSGFESLGQGGRHKLKEDLVLDVAFDLEVREDGWHVDLSPYLRTFGSSFARTDEVYLLAGQLEYASMGEAVDGGY